MADQDGPQAGLNARPEGDQVLFLQLLQAPAVQDAGHMGVSVLAVARKVLHNAAHPVLRHPLQGAGHILPGGNGVSPQGAAVEEGPGVRGNIAHRGQIDVQAQGMQKVCLFRLQAQGQLQPSGLEGLPRGGEGLPPEGGVAADPDHGAPLLVHCQQEGNISGCPVGFQLFLHGAQGLVIKVPAKEDQAPKLILADIVQSRFLPAPGQEELAHLLLQGHGFQDFPDRVCRFGGFRLRQDGLRQEGLRPGLRDRLRGSRFFLRPGAAHEKKSQAQYNQPPHTASSGIRLRSQSPFRYTAANTVAVNTQVMG